MYIYFRFRRLIAGVSLIYPAILLIAVLMRAAQLSDYTVPSYINLYVVTTFLWSGVSSASKGWQLFGRSFQPVKILALILWLVNFIVYLLTTTYNPEFNNIRWMFYIWIFGWLLVDLVDFVMFHYMHQEQKISALNDY